MWIYSTQFPLNYDLKKQENSKTKLIKALGMMSSIVF